MVAELELEVLVVKVLDVELELEVLVVKVLDVELELEVLVVKVLDVELELEVLVVKVLVFVAVVLAAAVSQGCASSRSESSSHQSLASLSCAREGF